MRRRWLGLAWALLCAALALSISAPAAAVPYPALHFRHLDAEAFPAERAFSALHQDAQGYLWVATYFGVHRYDGARLRSYAGCTQQGVAGGAYTTQGQFLEGEDGALWNLAYEALGRIHPEEGRMVCFPVPHGATGPAYIAQGVLDAQGRPVLATGQGLLRFDARTQRYETLFRPALLKSTPALWLRPEPGGYWFVYGQDLWWVPERGAARLAYRFPTAEYFDARLSFRDVHGALCAARGGRPECLGHDGVLRTYRDAQGQALAQCSSYQLDGDGRLWALCGQVLFRQSDASRPLMERVARLGDGPSANDVIVLDGRGVLWASLPAGLWLVDTHTLARRFLPHARQRPDAPRPSEGGTILFLEDRAGGMWTAGGGVGLSRATPEPPPIRHLRLPDPPRGHPVSQMVRAIHEDRYAGGRVLYVATYDREPWRLTLDARGDVAHAERLPLDAGREPPYASEQRALLRDARGDLWYGGIGGLWRWHAGRRRFEHLALAAAGAPEPVVQQLFERPDGSVWVLSDQGLARMPDALRARPTAPGRHAAVPMNWQAPPSHAEDASGHAIYAPSFVDGRGAWCLATWWGLLRYDPDAPASERWKRWHAADGLGHEVLHGVVERRPGDYWLATRGAGLTRLQGGLDAPRFSVHGLDAGLPDPVIYGLLADRTGALWLTHNRGLTRWDPDRGSMRHFGLGDGVQALEFNNGQAHLGASGHLYFGGTNGVNRIAPWALAEPRTPPHLAPGLVRVDGQSLAWAQVPGQLPAQTQLLEFSWSSVDASFASDLRVRYRLRGADAAWQAAGSAGIARYVRLAPGEYQFDIGVSNDGERWAATQTLRFEILAPWWRRPVPLLAAAVALGALALAYVLRQRRRRDRLRQALAAQREQLDLQHAELLQLREREVALAERCALAQDMHDGLGYNLRRAMAAAGRLRAPGERVVMLLEDCMAELHLMVDARHSGDEPLSAYLAQLRHRSAQVCEDAGLAMEWRTGPLHLAETLSVHARLNLGRLLMEAISNVLRHSQADVLHVEIVEIPPRAKDGDSGLAVRIRDDGCGFDVDEPRAAGAGLRSMRARAAQLGARLTLSSQTGLGTCVELRLPLRVDQEALDAQADLPRSVEALPGASA